MKALLTHLLGYALCVITTSVRAEQPTDPTALLYRQHCSSCHGEHRLGGTGPALLPENLGRLKPPDIETTIRHGRAATQMPAFESQLTAAQIEALAKHVRVPVTPPPVWDEARIRASRIVHADSARLPASPVFAADPLNLFVVVEGGDHAVTILDGDRLEPIYRFPSRFALHGGPKFSPDGRFVYFASRDGWISKFDIWNLTLVSEVRAGINTRNAAVSGDGKYVAVANYLPHSIAILDSDLNLLTLLPVDDGKGTSSRVSAIYDAAPRHSFIAALKDLREVWEISYAADPAVSAAVGRAAGAPSFQARRIALDDYLDDFFFSQDYRALMGASRGGEGNLRGQVLDLDHGRRIADLDLPGMPHLGSGITWMRKGRAVMATPNLNESCLSVIDMQNWRMLASIPMPGPGFFLRSHERSRYAWADSMLSPRSRDRLEVIDKDSLQIVASLRPLPGKTLAHVEFSRDGRYVLASVMERKADGGALIVFDALTLAEVKRIPMDKPIGKYNIFNKITRSEGTSH